MGALYLRGVGNHSSGHFHSYQRIAEHIGVGRQRELIKPLGEITNAFADFGTSGRAYCSARKETKAANCCFSTGKFHATLPIIYWVDRRICSLLARNGPRGRAVVP